jgi:competence protein ComEA
MPATTPAERKALLFIAFVAVLGSGARYAHGRRADRRPPAESVQALARQLAVVDSVRAGNRETGNGTRRLERATREGRPSGTSRGPSSRLSLPDLPASGGYAPVPFPVSPHPALVDVDHASAAELERLPGIGPALARRIVADRDSLGPFGSLRELERVAGVGPGLARRIEQHVTFSLTPRLHGGRRPGGPGRSGPLGSPRGRP